MRDGSIAQTEAAQIALRQLALERAEEILRVVPGQFAAGDDPLQRVVISLEPYADRHDFKMALEQKAADLLQRDVLSEPTQIRWWRPSFCVPPLSRNRFYLLQATGLWVDVIDTPHEFLDQHWSNTATTTSGKIGNLAVVHERVPLNQLEEMRSDMRANEAVRLDDCAGIGIRSDRRRDC